MPKSERIGSDALGKGLPMSTGMSEKKRAELKAKMKEELAKKKHEPEKTPSEAIPGDRPHEQKPGERTELDDVLNRLEEKNSEKDVHVNEHLRGHPKKKKVEEV